MNRTMVSKGTHEYLIPILYPGNKGGSLLTMRKRGWLRFFSVWTALVVTECAPEHHAREKSHGSLIT